MMPSRPITLAIIAFWLFTAGWMIVRDVLPAWRAGDAPPYTIELADETLPTFVPVKWSGSFNGQPIGHINTSMKYRQQDDTFELAAVSSKLILPVFGTVTIVADRFDDRVRITRDGELRAMASSADLTVEGIGVPLTGRFELTAQVVGSRLDRYAMFESRGFGRFEPPLEPVDPPQGRVLNPMHPVPRITGLHPGQTWQQSLLDPRTDILRAVYKQAGLDKLVPLPEPPKALTATVLSEPRSRTRNTSTRRCLVIQYRGGDDYKAWTWVAVTDGDVLRQEADFHGEKLVLERE